MQEVVTNLLARAGLPVRMEKARTKEGTIAVDWIGRVVFQRPQEIPHYLNNGHFDIAIVGEDWVANWGYEFPVLLKLPIGRGGNKAVNIVIAVSETEKNIHAVEDLPRSCEVATEYVQLAITFFNKIGRQDIRILPSFGNTEHKIRFGAKAIIDVTESGASLRANGLKIIATVMESNTLIVANERSFEDDEKKFDIDTFVRLVAGAVKAKQLIKIIANVPEASLEAARRIIGGLKGPSCSPVLGVTGWFALESMIPRSIPGCEHNEQQVIRDLLKIGVTDIVVDRDIQLVMS